MTTVEEIYQRYGDSFCLCPFLGSFYQSHRVVSEGCAKTTSTIVPCSVFDWDGRTDDFDLIDNSILTTVNSPRWKDLRQQFLAGKYKNIPQCSTCHNADSLGGSAPRIGANKHFTEHYTGDLIADIQEIIDNDLETQRLVSLDWFPSNYCNYSCVMCAGGASSSRMTFEIKIDKIDRKIEIKSVSDDFFQVLRSVEIINFTGGETLMQSQVVDIMQYMVDNKIASNKTIFILTNCSSDPDKFQFLFQHFRRVIFMCSLDGVGSVIEYQRRGCKWSVVENNSLKILKNTSLGSVINFVMTAINAPGAADFVDWLYQHSVSNGVSISPVFRSTYLDLSAMPTELRTHCRDRLEQRRVHYLNLTDPVAQNCRSVLDQMIQVIDSSPQFDPGLFDLFKLHMQQEDSVSRIPLIQAVPVWADYL
jgi:hypothetical protein